MNIVADRFVFQQYPQGNHTGTIDSEIASIGGTDYMYILAANATSVDVLSLDAPGQAKRIQTLDLASPAKTAGITISEYLLAASTIRTHGNC